MTLHVQLNSYPECFKTSSVDSWKSLNYVFGKNGSGKSTLAKELIEQNGNEYKAYLYDGSDGVIKDKEGKDKAGLNCILLGKKNVKIDGLIEEQQQCRAAKRIEEESVETQLNSQKEILKVKKEACETALWGDIQNRYNVFEEDLALIQVQKKKLWNRASKSAFFSSMTFLRDSTEYAENTISIDELLRMKHQANQDTIFKNYQNISVWNDFSDLCVTLKIAIKTPVLNEYTEQLNKNHLEKWFARGWDIIQSDTNRKCPFCGQSIDTDCFRNIADIYEAVIDASYQALSSDLANLKESINQYEHDVKKLLHDSQEQSDQQVNQEYKIRVRQTADSFDEIMNGMKSEIERKSDDPSHVVPDTTIKKWEKSLESLIISWNGNIKPKNQLINKHNEIVQGREAVLEQFPYKVLGSVKNCLQQENYQKLWFDIDKAQQRVDGLNEDLVEVSNYIEGIDKKIDDLRKQTVDEQQAAEEVNTILKAMGNTSFTLAREGEIHGLYKVKGSSGKIRPITELSTGEKNLIAFLYFMINLRADLATNNKAKPLVVFDDPMNSNDDAAQYILATEISSLNNIISERGGILIVLTHNAYFYLNVRPATYKSRREAYFVLDRSSGKTEIVEIKRGGNQDVQTGYDALWNNLYFAYAQNNISLMWNQTRRILETYQNFNNSHQKLADAFQQIKNPADKLIAKALLKSLNVESHDISDLEYIPSHSTPDNLKQLLKDVFVNLGAEEHFNIHWENASPSPITDDKDTTGTSR